MSAAETKTPINKTLPFGSQKVFCFENASKDIILREGPRKGSQGQFYILQKTQRRPWLSRLGNCTITQADILLSAIGNFIEFLQPAIKV